MSEQKSEIRVILNERGSRYGTLLGNGRVAQRLKETVRSLGSRWNDMPEDQKEAIDNILQKIARTVTGDPFYLDNWLDIIGYAQLVIDEIRERQNPEKIEYEKENGPVEDAQERFPDVLHADVIAECGKKYRRCLAIELYDELHEESKYYERSGIGFLYFTPIPDDRAVYPKCKALSLVDYYRTLARSDRKNGDSE